MTLHDLSNDLNFILQSGEVMDLVGEEAEFVLVGHSVGGSVVTHLASSNIQSEENSRIRGVMALDTFEREGNMFLTKLPSLFENGMIPSSFSSVEEGVEWAVANKRPFNSSSASLSTPHLLSQPTPPSEMVEWRTDLLSFEEDWETWFEGFSSSFCSLPVPSLMVVSGQRAWEQLDVSIIIGEKNGTCQVLPVPHSFHCIQEDCPGELSGIISDFVNKRILNI